MQETEIFSTTAAALIDALHRRDLTLATAESCTGGQMGDALTNVTGASHVYSGGVIAYCNELKMRVLNVPSHILEAHGAVSGPTAEAMAAGVRELSGADIALSTTGIAGPGGGSAEKPVGLVYIGLASATGTWHEKHIWDGNRYENKRQSIRRAFEWLCEWLEEHHDKS